MEIGDIGRAGGIAQGDIDVTDGRVVAVIHHDMSSIKVSITDQIDHVPVGPSPSGVRGVFQRSIQLIGQICRGHVEDMIVIVVIDGKGYRT